MKQYVILLGGLVVLVAALIAIAVMLAVGAGRSRGTVLYKVRMALWAVAIAALGAAGLDAYTAATRPSSPGRTGETAPAGSSPQTQSGAREAKPTAAGHKPERASETRYRGEEARPRPKVEGSPILEPQMLNNETDVIDPDSISLEGAICYRPATTFSVKPEGSTLDDRRERRERKESALRARAAILREQPTPLKPNLEPLIPSGKAPTLDPDEPTALQNEPVP